MRIFHFLADQLATVGAEHGQVTLSQLWIAFGVGKHLRYVPVHDNFSSMGQQKSRALLAFNAFTGSDQTSSFANKGKKTEWDTWAICDEVTDVFEV